MPPYLPFILACRHR